MKIAINVTRDNVGGITSSNLNLMNYLYKLDYEFTGLELTSRMYMKGASLFRGFAPEIFDHHIINIHHLPLIDSMKHSKTLKDVENIYKEPIKILRNILRNTRPDVVLLSGTYYMPWLISIAAKKEDIPAVLWYSGVLSKEVEHYHLRIKKILLAMEKAVVKRKIKKSYIIPNPVAHIFTEPRSVETSVDRRIAAVGRYSKIKNFTIF